MNQPDFLIVGGGVLGLSIGLELKRRQPGARVRILEKEERCGHHASGRNSGVLHAGFYYSADSLKARFTREGNRRLKDYCTSKKLPLLSCGKLVVAKDESEHKGLDLLLERGRANGVRLESITEAEALKIEPRVKTSGRAIFSPDTAVLDPRAVMEALRDDALQAGLEISEGERFASREGKGLRTNRGLHEPGFLINAAGLQADRLAQAYDFGLDYRILPFKGVYLYSEEAPWALKVPIYPVPDLNYPFLGVHFTVMVDGRSKIGPTAIPALWREQYGWVQRFKAGEFAEILFRLLGLMLSKDPSFRRLALAEIRKYSRGHLAAQASRLRAGVTSSEFRHWGPPGIRAQLLDVKKGKLVMDFLLEGDSRSMHVLNAVSPGFTCAFPFADHICDRILAAGT